jgi:hypothetical protein
LRRTVDSLMMILNGVFESEDFDKGLDLESMR